MAAGLHIEVPPGIAQTHGLGVGVDDGLRDHRLGQIELVRINGDGVQDRRDLVVLVGERRSRIVTELIEITTVLLFDPGLRLAEPQGWRAPRETSEYDPTKRGVPSPGFRAAMAPVSEARVTVTRQPHPRRPAVDWTPDSDSGRRGV